MFIVRKRVNFIRTRCSRSPVRSFFSSNNKKPNEGIPKTPSAVDQQNDEDPFLSSLFQKSSTWFPEKMPSVEEFHSKLTQLYPALAQQLQEGYEKLGDYLSNEDFRKRLEELGKESTNVKRHPELSWDAEVRESSQLSREEKEYTVNRKEFQKRAFAAWMGLDPDQVDDRDLPVIGIASSGGGYRAMIGLVGYIQAFRQSGIWDCVRYVSGISGSCWAMSMYYHPRMEVNPKALAEHLKAHCDVHWANMSAFLQTLTISPEHTKNLLGGIIQRGTRAHLVDLFGVFLGTSLWGGLPQTFRPSGISTQQEIIAKGQEPMPIYCVVRHDSEKKDIYQWFEFTPYEMGSEDLEAWIPTWAFGRTFKEGKNTNHLPEQPLEIMNGMFGSAFAASLVHFYQEFRHYLNKNFREKMDAIVKEHELSMSNIHPISPSSFPNPFGKDDLLLMDAGMDNNIPFYPLLRDGRDVDAILAVDLSADIQTAPHFKRAESYVKRRGIEGWPKDAGWREDKPLGTCTVFDSQATEKDHKRPITLIYFPFILNPSYDNKFDPQTAKFCSTWNFVYQKDQVDQVIGLAEANVNENLETVKETLIEIYKKKKQQRLAKESQQL
ncbi:acyl transferase/acyl hydrolase/lysophospholipase [Sporodiniella umbellata]|nr:acyl transferase/acyl hydrolase/lysophospholipase [Sporodiniella umbellata]